MTELNVGLVAEVGRFLRNARLKAGLTQVEVSRRLGFRSSGGCSYVWRLEQGKIANPGLMTVVRFLEACGAKPEEFWAVLAGQAQPVCLAVTPAQPEKTAKQLAAEKRQQDRERKAAMIEMLTREVTAAIGPKLHGPFVFRLGAYQEGARLFYNAWRAVLRETKGKDPGPLIKAKFDALQQNASSGLDPELVALVRAIVEQRLLNAPD